MRFQWTGIREEEFIALFPVTTNPQLAALCGLTTGAVATRGRLLGLRKTAEHTKKARGTRSPECRAAIGRANAGRVVTEETRRKLSAAFKGRTLSEEARQRISIGHKLSPKTRRGPDHEWWTGQAIGPRPRTPREHAWRTGVLERDDWTCQDCQRRFGRSSRGKLVAHHIQSWRDHPEVRYELSNGVTLCCACHNGRHGWKPPHPQTKPCECGCGLAMPARDNQGRVHRYLKNHSPAYRASRSRAQAPQIGLRISEGLKRAHAEGRCDRMRAPVGESHYAAKLTEDQVRDIRARHARGEGLSSLGRTFGVHEGTIRFIVRRQTWRHVL